MTNEAKQGVSLGKIALGVALGLILFIIILLVGCIGCAGIIGAGIQSEQAKMEDNAVITMAEFKAIQNDMTYDQVKQVIGAEGEEESNTNVAGYSTIMYSWKNPDFSNANVMIQNGRVISKAQFNLK